MNIGIIFAIIAALAFGIWTVFHQQATAHVNPLFGAIIVSLTAAILGFLILLPQIGSLTLYTNSKGIIFAVLAGLCALAIDFFALKAYGTGLQISLGGPLIIGGGVAVAAFIGLLMGDSMNIQKIIGLAFTIIGSALLAASV